MKLRAPFDLDTVQPEPFHCDNCGTQVEYRGLCHPCDDATPKPWDMPPVCRHCGRTNTPLGVCDRCYVRYYESATA